MPASPQEWSHDQTQCLMNIAASLGELTQNPEQLPVIPTYLARVLQLDRLTLAVVRDTPVGPEILLSHSSGDFSQTSPRFTEEILTLYFRTRPVSESHGPVFHAHAAGEAQSVEQPEPVTTFPQATVIARSMGQGFRMLLIVHQSVTVPAMSVALTEMLQAIASTLVRFLSCATVWLFHPESLGEPFCDLTQREWTVLRGLQTGAGEKQLADQLHMSRHTLHSHVKSIYRKVGAPSRLLLMLRVQSLLRDMRIAKLENGQPTVTDAVGSGAAVTV